MYGQFRDQAHRWLIDNPHARIAVITAGFSRGAVEATLFANTVDQYGIQNQDNALPHLVGAQRVPQAALLFDPVATGDLEQYRRSLPGSVITGMQFTAMDEGRSLFPVTNVIPTLNSDPNFAHVRVPGGHSDIGGAMLPERGRGIGDITGNMGAMFINDLTQRQVVREVPTGDLVMRINTIDSTGQSLAGFVTGRGYSADRLAESGQINDLDGAVVRPEPPLNPTRAHPHDMRDALLADQNLIYPSLNPPTTRADLKTVDPATLPTPTPENAKLLDDATRRAKEVLAHPDGFRAVTATLDRIGDPLRTDLMNDKPEVVNRLAADLTASAVVNKLERIDAAYLHQSGGQTLLVGYQNHQHPELVKSAFSDLETALRTPAQQNLDKIALQSQFGVPDQNHVLTPLEHGPASSMRH